MLLERLTQTFGVSGRETLVADLIENEIQDYCDEIIRDDIGNLIAIVKGSGDHKKRIMFAAHMDEIGFAITEVTDKGLIRVRNLGGINLFMSAYGRIQFQKGAQGVICYEGKGDQPNDMNKLFVDIGARSKEEALEEVSIGETASFVGPMLELQNERVVAKALDNRIACFIGIEALKRIENPYNDIYMTFTVQEEVGLRGSKVAANRINPDIGIAIDVTISADTPNVTSKSNAKLGNGTAIKVIDNSVICDEYLVDQMVKISEENNIPYQMDVISGGGTDAGAMNVSNNGVKAGGISVPMRYVHGPSGMIDMKDTNACIELVVKYVDCEFEF